MRHMASYGVVDGTYSQKISDAAVETRHTNESRFTIFAQMADIAFSDILTSVLLTLALSNGIDLGRFCYGLRRHFS